MGCQRWLLPRDFMRKKKKPLTEIFGYSPASVMRTLGREQFTVAEVREILKAKRIKCSDATVNMQVGNGRNGRMAGTESGKVNYAPLTREQVRELKSLIREGAR